MDKRYYTGVVKAIAARTDDKLWEHSVEMLFRTNVTVQEIIDRMTELNPAGEVKIRLRLDYRSSEEIHNEME